jgi:predicted ATPase/class 3 adenylate cyclase
LQVAPDQPIEPAHEEVLQSMRSLLPQALADKIDAAAPHVAGERREVTILDLDFGALGGSNEHLDSEQSYLLVDEAMRKLAAVVYEYEGTIDRYTGSGLVALFGLPVAHENDPERALRASLSMMAVLQPLQSRISEQYGVELKIRIGIHTGLLIGGKIGSDRSTGYTVVGDTLDTARYLQDEAEPGSVLVSFPTYQRTRPLFEFQAVSHGSVGPPSRPIRAFRLLRLRPRPERIRGLPGMQVTMVGRKDGLAQLNDALDLVRHQQQASIAFVTGDAGVGKSRLVTEFFKAQAHHDVQIYQGNCLAYARTKPLWLLADMLRAIVQISETSPVDSQWQALEAFVNRLELPGEELLPYLADVLSIEQREAKVAARLRSLEGNARRKLTYSVLRQAFVRLAQQAPTVFVFEDLHWIDPASRDFVVHLIETLDDAALMLVLVSRPEERDTVVRPLIEATGKRPDGFADIFVPPLSEAEGELLVSQLLPHGEGNTTQVRELIVKRAAGNPFYAEEIVRMLLDAGGLVPHNGQYEVTPQANELLETVPGTLKGLIQSRLDRLPHELYQTLVVAAVLGPAFPSELWHCLAGGGDRIPEAVLRELRTKQLIFCETSRHEECMFGHALIQEVMYDTLLARTRARLHEQVAQTVEQGAYWSPDQQAEALAYHYSRSTQPLKALPYLAHAGANAVQRCAYETAIQHYRLAMKLVVDSDSRATELHFEIQLGLSRALKFIGRYAEASRILREALGHLVQPEVIEQPSAVRLWVQALTEMADVQVREGALGEAIAYLQAGLDLLGEGAVQDSPQLWRILIDRLALIRFRQGQLDEAFDLANSAVLSLPPGDTEDEMVLASLYNTLGGVSWQKGNLSEAATYVQRSLDLYQQVGYLWGMANAHSNLGILHYRLGNWYQTLEDWEHALDMRRTMGDVQSEALTLSNLGQLLLSMGEHKQASEHYSRSLAMGERLGDHWTTANSLIGLAHLAVFQTRFQEAQDFAEQALDLAENIGSSENQIQASWLLALIRSETDGMEKGLDLAWQALDLARQNGLRDMEADCLRVLGVLRARTGEWLEAETHFHESIEVCLQQKDPYRQGLALLEMGRLFQHLARAGDLAGTGWQARALEILQEASALFQQLGAAYDLKATDALLVQIERGAETAAPAGLPQGEWRTAAIVWIDLTPSPDADEEQTFEAMAGAMAALIAISKEYRGRMIQRRDGATIVFGAPVSYEDDAERAVRAASRAIYHVMEANRHSTTPLTCRAAVSHGTLIAGQVGPQFHSEFAVRGAPVDQARSLAQSTPPGTVWVTDSVRTTTERRFEYELLPSSRIDHLVGERVSGLLGLRAQPEPTRGLPGIEARFVGRESALQLMTNVSGHLKQGLGALIWLEGEPGIGKSRLMREFTARIEVEKPRLWRGRCTPHRSGHAFSLFTDLLGHALNIQPSDSMDKIRVKIDQVIQTWPRDAQSTRPHLEALLGLEPSGFVGERLASLQPEQLQRQIFVALRKLFKSLASENPLIVIADDLHWSDPVSAELLLFLVTMVTSEPILFVCAQRRQGADSPNDRLIRTQSLISSQTIRLQLERLSVVESELLLAELLSHQDLPGELVSAIVHQSEGNPYFLEEYIRMLIEQGLVSLAQDGWVLNPDLDPEDLPLPSSLETLIRSRIDALPADLKQLVQYGSIIGSPFEARLLESIPQLPNVQVNLTRLESRLILHTADEPGRWQFNHSLIETVAYETVLRARRQALHLEVAEAMESHWSGFEADHAEELAHHYSRAVQGAKALSYLMLAGERATAQYANQEALSFFEQATQQLNALSDPPLDLQYRLAIGLGDVHREMGQYVDSRAALEQALNLVESGQLSERQQAGLYLRLGETIRRQGDPDAAHSYTSRALHLLDEPDDRETQTEAVRLLTNLAWIHFSQGKFEQALQQAEDGLALAERAGALNELSAVENLMGGIHYSQSQWSEALHHTTRAMVLREQLGYTWGVAASLSNLGILAQMSGQWSKAWSFFERSLAIRQEIGDVEGIANAHNNLGTLAQDQGKSELAEKHLKASLEIAIPFQLGVYVIHANMTLAKVLLWRGEMEAARSALATSTQEAELLGAKHALAENTQILAQILMAEGDLLEAKKQAEHSAAIAVEIGMPAVEAAARRTVAEIDLHLGDLAAARESLAKAQRLLDTVTDELQTGWAAALAGRISLAKGQVNQAEKDLQVARDIFGRLGAGRDLKQVQDTIRRLPRPDASELLKVLGD